MEKKPEKKKSIKKQTRVNDEKKKNKQEIPDLYLQDSNVSDFNSTIERFVPHKKERKTDRNPSLNIQIDKKGSDKIKNIAKQHKISITELCRQMLTFALDHYDSQS